MKIAIIFRGVPGSGKSTLAKLMTENFKDSALHAIDDLHSSPSGFFWDESKAEALYLVNYANFIKSCDEGRKFVICDCMNLKFAEVELYADAARKFGYQVYVISPDLIDEETATERNKHQVSKVQIAAMISSWENWPKQTSLDNT